MADLVAIAEAILPAAQASPPWERVDHALGRVRRSISLDDPASLGDGQKFTIQSADRPLKVVAKIAGEKPTAVEVWNGNARLATISGEPWQTEVGPLKPGIHSIIVKAIDPVAARCSRPHTIVVDASSAASGE